MVNHTGEFGVMKTSRQQLEEDFLHFPPAPLEDNDIGGSFKIVRYRELSYRLVSLKILMGRLVRDKNFLRCFFIIFYMPVFLVRGFFRAGDKESNGSFFPDLSARKGCGIIYIYGSALEES